MRGGTFRNRIHRGPPGIESQMAERAEKRGWEVDHVEEDRDKKRRAMGEPKEAAGTPGVTGIAQKE